MTASSPIVTSGHTITPPPNHTPSPMVIGFCASHPNRRCTASIGCVGVSNSTPGPTCTSSPIHTCPTSRSPRHIDESIPADRGLVAVIEIHRRANHRPRTDPAEQLAQQLCTSAGLGRTGGVVLLDENRAPHPLEGEFWIAGAVPASGQHPALHLTHITQHPADNVLPDVSFLRPRRPRCGGVAAWRRPSPV